MGPSITLNIKRDSLYEDAFTQLAIDQGKFSHDSRVIVMCLCAVRKYLWNWRIFTVDIFVSGHTTQISEDRCMSSSPTLREWRKLESMAEVFSESSYLNCFTSGLIQTAHSSRPTTRACSTQTLRSIWWHKTMLYTTGSWGGCLGR